VEDATLLRQLYTEACGELLRLEAKRLRMERDLNAIGPANWDQALDLLLLAGQLARLRGLLIHLRETER
jgi:hypothetical protein